MAVPVRTDDARMESHTPEQVRVERRSRPRDRPEIQVPRPVAVMVAEADPSFARRIRDALVGDRIRLVRGAANAAGAVQAALDGQPDICLLDVEMPGGGVTASWEIKARLPRAKIVLFSTAGSEEDLFAGLRTGIHGFLLKDMNLDRLAPALLDVHAGNAALPRHLTARLLDHYRQADPSWRGVVASGGLGRLTSREWQVLELLSRELSTYEIAERLVLTPSAVRCHISAAVRKLGVGSRQEAAAMFRDAAA